MRVMGVCTKTFVRYIPVENNMLLKAHIECSLVYRITSKALKLIVGLHDLKYNKLARCVLDIKYRIDMAKSSIQ